MTRDEFFKSVYAQYKNAFIDFEDGEFVIYTGLTFDENEVVGMLDDK